MQYFHKYGLTTNGIQDENAPSQKDYTHIFCSGWISFLAMWIILMIEHHTDFQLIVASFGASAVLLYDASSAPFSQPRNVVGGHAVSALCGVGWYTLFMLNDGKYFYTPIVGAFAVSSSIMLMGWSQTTHPPGAASALIAVIGPPQIINLGFMYVIHPIISGACVLVCLAVVLNNLLSTRQYPTYWY